MKDLKKNWFKNLSLMIGLVLLGVILIITIASLKTTGQCYKTLKDADLSRGIESTLYYDDHMYASIGFGISVLPDEAGSEERVSSFLASSMQEIDMRILSCGLLYSMMVSVVLQYFLYCRYHNDRKKYFIGIGLASIGPFAVFAAVVFVSQRIFGLPSVFPNGHEWLLIAVGLLSVMAGNCVLGAVLSAVRHKKLAAVLAIPAVFFLFIVSLNFEGHLYANPAADSFDYFYETHSDALKEDYDGELYYDEEKNAVILDGTEYPAEVIENPDYYSRLKRAGAFLFEFLDAYSGNGLLMTETILEKKLIPVWAATAYLLKAAIWMCLSLCFLKRRSTRDPIRQG